MTCDCGDPAVYRVMTPLTRYASKLVTIYPCQQCYDLYWRQETKAGIAIVQKLEGTP